ncbi:HAMP domain-containing protein [Vibrio sp. T187]|uniref:sensor histidine kinase n=1 Tax=Vibrio TaxID=662 RepID=UPI0010C9ED7C|nr:MULTISPECIES: ATP-binding protein [Vibrio]MBW3695299.1 HAMP domain-containing protein [Vibrio sp. T187]
MRRIYLESILGLFGCFIASLFLYEISVYQLNTDYEFVLEDYEALAYQNMVDNIATNQGLEAAHQALYQFADTARSKLVIHSPSDELPQEVADFFASQPNQTIYHDDDRQLWFRLSDSNNTYHYLPDEQTFVREKVALEDNLIWAFFISGFMVYGVGHLFIIFRRVKKLEQVTLRFAEGDLSARANTSKGSAIGSLNQSFNVMAERIHHLIESNRSLTNAVAHEMRTPVFRIQWQAELLKDTPLSDTQRQTVESIVEDTEEMEQMVDELLYYAKLDNRRLELSFEALDLSSYFPVAIQRWSKETSLPIHFRNSNQEDNLPLNVNVDKRLLSRALDNLLRNAFKYANSQVLITIEHSETVFHISIHDDGPGVDEVHQAHLFDAFYVGDKARNKAKNGHGLGLSIVKKVCEQHSATVEVGHSSELHGARFTMTFPQA